jgi:hypothetical protein
MRHACVGKKLPLNSETALNKELAGLLHRHLPHQGHSERHELLGEVLAASLSGRGHTEVLPSLQRRHRGSAQTITYSLLKTLKRRLCFGLTWQWQVTEVMAWALSLGHNASPLSTFNTKVKDLALSRASTTRQPSPSPSNCLNVFCGVTGLHHPAAVKPPPDSAGNSEEPVPCGI